MKFLMKWILIIGVIVGITSLYFVLGRPADAGGVVVSEISASSIQTVQSNLSNSLEEQIRSLEKYLNLKARESYKDEMKQNRSLLKEERLRYEEERTNRLKKIRDALEETKEFVDGGGDRRYDEVVVGYARDRFNGMLGPVWRKLSDF